MLNMIYEARMMSSKRLNWVRYFAGNPIYSQAVKDTFVIVISESSHRLYWWKSL